MKKLILMTAIAATTLTLAAPASAKPIRPDYNTGSSTTVGDLKKKGFKCAKVVAGFHECRKGGTVYYCGGSSNSSKCHKIRTAPTKPLRPSAPLGGQFYLNR